METMNFASHMEFLRQLGERYRDLGAERELMLVRQIYRLVRDAHSRTGEPQPESQAASLPGDPGDPGDPGSDKWDQEARMRAAYYAQGDDDGS